MTDNILALNFKGVKVILDDNTILVRLTVPPSSSTDTTFHNTVNDTNYQVPSGKKATIIFIEQWKITNNALTFLGFADNADGDTNAVSLFKPNVITTITDLIFISAEVPADKFINWIEPGTGDVDNVPLVVFAIEENA